MSRRLFQDEGEHSADDGVVASAAPAAPVSLSTPEAVLAMQRHAGNAAVARTLARQEAPAASETPQQLVERHTSMLNVDEEGIARDCLAKLPGDPVFVNQVFDHLSSSDRDDVASYIMDSGEWAKLHETARSAEGKRTLLRIVRELGAGWTTGGEQQQMQDLLRVIAAEGQVDDEGNPRNIEVEVLTFETGSLDVIPRTVDDITRGIDESNESTPMNNPTPNLTGGLAEFMTGRRILGPGVRGHTAIVVDGVVYSFEMEWTIAGTKEDYLAAKSAAGHDATGQVLRVTQPGAREIQSHLIGRADTGMYLIGGEGICVDAAADQLKKVIHDLPSHDRFDVQDFKAQLRASGLVERETSYPARPPAPAGGP